MSSVIECKNIIQRFQKKEVLKNIDLTAKAGEIIGLLGPSGAGKTTLIKILTGQLVQTSGNATLLGMDTRKLNQGCYRRIGMMLDDFGLYERLSVYDNLKLFARLYSLPSERIDTVLRRVELWDARRRTVSRLSKGMRGRLALARAVLHEPEVLFLDEPTAALDPATAERIHHLIREEQERGTTIFLTTHNMAEAERLCSHVALLNEGSIVEYGEPGEICRRYDHQNKLRIRLHDGISIELINHPSSADAVKEYIASRQLETIHTTEANLETVFIEITGRGLE